SPLTIGDDAPSPGMGTFQTMPWVVDHDPGSDATSLTPLPSGPRHRGQSDGEEQETRIRSTAEAARRMPMLRARSEVDDELDAAVDRAAGGLGVVGGRLVRVAAGGAEHRGIEPSGRLRAGHPSEHLAGAAEREGESVLLVGGRVARDLDPGDPALQGAEQLRGEVGDLRPL